MRSITAVEIGADTCALASTSVRDGEVYVTAAETLDPASFPGIEAFTSALQQTRTSLKLPRRCRAVVWGLPDGASRRDPIVGPLIEPLTRAGFKVGRVVTPCNALGALARLRTSRTGGAMCWLGVNRNGVALVVIRPGQLLYSHSFAWDSNVGASGSQARLLQRYSLVAFLAPEVRRALAASQQKGAIVEGIVTCGNLPDLRSLTMPLIEELDIEVETLDSLEGLQMKAELADKLSEVAPAIRLACAGAFARESRTVSESTRRRVRRTTRVAAFLPAVALLALVAGAGYWYYARTRAASPAPGPLLNTAQKRPAAAPPPVSSVTLPPATEAATAPTPVVMPSPTVTPAVTGDTPPGAAGTAKREPPSVAPPVLKTPPPPAVTPPAATTGAGARSEVPARAVNSVPALADKPHATSAARAVTAPEGVTEPPMPELLKDPVPRVTAILVSADRRLATVGDEGQIIAVGDTVGRRVVIAIDDRTVLLREPSGVQIRVALGGRVVGVERGGGR